MEARYPLVREDEEEDPYSLFLCGLCRAATEDEEEAADEAAADGRSLDLAT